MERNEFIKSLGLGMALVCTGSCFSGCGKSTDAPDPGTPGGGTPPPAGGGASVNLASQLLTVGASLVVSGVLFIRTATGNTTASFVATQATCPHQGGSLGFVQASNLIQCSLHAARYSTAGAVISPPNDGGTTTALRVYSLTIAGDTLTATT